MKIAANVNKRKWRRKRLTEALQKHAERDKERPKIYARHGARQRKDD